MKASERILNELKNSAPVEWQPGMSLQNTNGAIDPASTGYQYAIQTTTYIRAKTVDQKFYEVPFADFIPVEVGEGAWMEDIRTNRVYDVAGDFESGLINLGSDNARLGQVQVAVDNVTQKIATWAKSYNYAIAEINKALSLNNWDVVSAKMKSLKRNWDLGLQQVAFLGLKSDLTNFPGLLSNSGVNVDTSTITKNISAMSNSEFQTLVKAILAAYFSNSNNTVLPDTFEIPMDDYLGLGAYVNPAYPILTMRQALENTFRELTQNPKFTIYGLAYGTMANNAGFWTANGTSRYCLYRKDPETVRLTLPVDFTLGAPNTGNNFQWDAVAYGQFTGVGVFRTPEVMYFDHT